MANDLSRMRLDPMSNYAGVELRQGAVLLDADANESTGILDRRLRALASDTLGRARVASTTPDAFHISVTPSNPPMLKIGKGRLYVDGVLAENHGVGASMFDALMAETVLSDAVPYDRQPYLHDAPALPTTGRHIVYLDTWYRTVTHVEAPDLVEIAVGVPASGRMQAAWQVRVLDQEVATGATCETADEAWNALIAPSTGLLGTGTFDDPAVADPCELPPSGGYRGLENQLYRVEIHAPGHAGQGATFTWSRDNASVVEPVEQWESDTKLQLQSLGRDDVLGFRTGDWVEITNDAYEFLRKPGEMRRITVDRQTRHITFTDPLPAELGIDPGVRRLRAIRWDGARKVYALDANGVPVQIADLDDSTSDGTIAVPDAGGTVLLENGITVTFDETPGGAGFRTGDFWVFAARTADASVERLDKAPPRGTHHHHARLALWDAGTGMLTDCRQGWPPPVGGDDCACTVCIRPRDADKLQDAIERIREHGGGTICLDIGEYVLKGPLLIDKIRSLRIVGKGTGTLLRSERGPGVMQIDNSGDVVLSAFSMGKGEARSKQAILQVGGSSRIGLDRVTFLADGGEVAAIALGGDVDGLWIEDCEVSTPIGIVAGERTRVANLRVDASTLRCAQGALAFTGSCQYAGTLRISRNHIESAKQVAIALSGKPEADAAIDIEANRIHAPSCIDATLNRMRIAGNVLQGVEGAGTAVMLSSGSLEDLMVTGNRVNGFADGITAKGAIQRAMVQANQIETSRNGIVLEGGRLATVEIARNQVRTGDGLAVRVRGEAGWVAVAGNQIEATNRGSAVHLECATCTLEANQCAVQHVGDTPAVLVRGRSAIAASNRIRGDGQQHGVSLQVDARVLTVLGNIVNGAIRQSVPNPPSLNVEGASD